MERVLFIPGSYDEDRQRSFWKGAIIKTFFEVDVHDPRKIEENGQVVGDDIMEKMLLYQVQKRLSRSFRCMLIWGLEKLL